MLKYQRQSGLRAFLVSAFPARPRHPSATLFVGGADRTRQVGPKNDKAPAGAVVRALALATERP